MGGFSDGKETKGESFWGGGVGKGPDVSQEGTEVSVGEFPSMTPGDREEGSASRCSVNETWKELKTLEEAGSQSRYALE